MTELKPQATTCPNCRQPAIQVGNEITCEHCDAVFVITRKQGAKVKQVGKIEDHEQRIQRLESLLPGEEQGVESTEPEEKEEPILPE